LKPITVTTQFITADGTDHGNLTEVRQFYQQEGKAIEHPHYTVNGKQHNTTTDEFCADWVATTQDGTNCLEKGGLGAVERAIDAGVVLVVSLWVDHYANMFWLDSTIDELCADIRWHQLLGEEWFGCCREGQRNGCGSRHVSVGSLDSISSLAPFDPPPPAWSRHSWLVMGVAEVE